MTGCSPAPRSVENTSQDIASPAEEDATPKDACPLAAAFADRSTALCTFSAGEDIFRPGEPASFVYRITEGAVISYRLYTDGRRQVTGFSLPGDFLGLEAGVEYRTHAQALGPVAARILRRARLSALAASDGMLARALWRTSLCAFQRSEDHAMILARQGATERVATFLLDYADRIDAKTAIDLPMSRQDIADHLGLTIHTVSRTLSQLQAGGLIEARSSRHVRLLRRDRLEALRQ